MPGHIRTYLNLEVRRGVMPFERHRTNMKLRETFLRRPHATLASTLKPLVATKIDTSWTTLATPCFWKQLSANEAMLSLYQGELHSHLGAEYDGPAALSVVRPHRCAGFTALCTQPKTMSAYLAGRPSLRHRSSRGPQHVVVYWSLLREKSYRQGDASTAAFTRGNLGQTSSLPPAFGCGAVWVSRGTESFRSAGITVLERPCPG